jgi:hypothetical protein
MAFLLGLLLPVYTITGYDASAHTSEETVKAAHNVPAGMPSCRSRPCPCCSSSASRHPTRTHCRSRSDSSFSRWSSGSPPNGGFQGPPMGVGAAAVRLLAAEGPRSSSSTGRKTWAAGSRRRYKASADTLTPPRPTSVDPSRSTTPSPPGPRRWAHRRCSSTTPERSSSRGSIDARRRYRRSPQLQPKSSTTSPRGRSPVRQGDRRRIPRARNPVQRRLSRLHPNSRGQREFDLLTAQGVDVSDEAVAAQEGRMCEPEEVAGPPSSSSATTHRSSTGHNLRR